MRISLEHSSSASSEAPASFQSFYWHDFKITSSWISEKNTVSNERIVLWLEEGKILFLHKLLPFPALSPPKGSRSLGPLSGCDSQRQWCSGKKRQNSFEPGAGRRSECAISGVPQMAMVSVPLHAEERHSHWWFWRRGVCGWRRTCSRPESNRSADGEEP